MAEITVVNDKSELYNVINQKKSEGYLETELAVISKSKLHLDDLHNSQISMIATSGSFSDRMSRLLTGEDGEEAVLSRYNLTEDELERIRNLIINQTKLSKVHIITKINPDLIGGFRVKVGTTVLDGSVKSDLEQIERKFRRVN